jgi:hypothetical protein
LTEISIKMLGPVFDSDTLLDHLLRQPRRADETRFWVTLPCPGRRRLKLTSSRMRPSLVFDDFM